MIDLFGANWDVVQMEAGSASSCLRTLLLVSNVVVGVDSGAAEVLGLDWTSSLGEMSSKWRFLKVELVLDSFVGSRLQQTSVSSRAQ